MEAKRANFRALLPIAVFLVLYLGTGLRGENTAAGICLQILGPGTSVVIYCLGLHSPIAGGPGSIPCLRTRVPML